MEGGQQQSMMSSDIQEIGGSSSNGGKSSSSSSFMCRQSSTRWTPTTEQIRILKELYYNNGVRSPTAEQIQRISAKLRQYGKIEGKNVFYWFQNHKARERQKKRFTADHHHHQIPTMHRKIIINDPPPPYQHDLLPPHLSPINFSPASPYNINTPSPAGHFPSSSTCSPGFITTHHVGNSYGSIAMEKSFRECSIDPSGNVGGQNIAWIGVDPHHHHHQQHNPFLENRRYTTNCKSTSTRDFQTLGMAAAEEEEEEEELDQIETLPLFPMHGDLINNDYFSGWHRRRGGGGADDDSSLAAGPMASLELTLNSYAARFSTS